MTITAKSQISLCKESTWGDPGSNSFNLFPCNPPSMSHNYDSIVDQGIRGIPAKDFGVYRGAGVTEATLEGIFYPEELGYLCFGILGSASVSGTAAPYTHTFVLGENPPSFAIQDYPKLQAPGGAEEPQSYVYKGCMLSNFVLRFNAGEGAVGFSSTFVGKSSGTQTPEAVVGTPNPAFLGWQGSVDIADYGGGYSEFGQVVSAEWTFARETILQHALNNTIEPSFGYSGPVEATVAMTIKFHADSDISRYRDDTHMKVKMTLVNGTKQLILEAFDVYFDNAPEWDRSAIDVKANLALRCLYDSTEATPVKITLLNNKGSYSA